MNCIVPFSREKLGEGKKKHGTYTTSFRLSWGGALRVVEHYGNDELRECTAFIDRIFGCVGCRPISSWNIFLLLFPCQALVSGQQHAPNSLMTCMKGRQSLEATRPFVRLHSPGQSKIIIKLKKEKKKEEEERKNVCPAALFTWGSFIYD